MVLAREGTGGAAFLPRRTVPDRRMFRFVSPPEGDNVTRYRCDS